jgi:trehalose-6-phosphate synthase
MLRHSVAVGLPLGGRPELRLRKARRPSLRATVIVNPHDPDDVAAAIDQAIRMPLDERKERHRALFTRVRERDAAAWRNAFLADLNDAAG